MGGRIRLWISGGEKVNLHPCYRHRRVWHANRCDQRGPAFTNNRRATNFCESERPRVYAASDRRRVHHDAWQYPGDRGRRSRPSLLVKSLAWLSYQRFRPIWRTGEICRKMLRFEIWKFVAGQMRSRFYEIERENFCERSVQSLCSMRVQRTCSWAMWSGYWSLQVSS